MNLFVYGLIIFVANAEAFAPNQRAPAKTKCAPLHMGLLSRFRKKKEIVYDPIKIGSPLPETDVQTLSHGEIVPMTIQEALGDGKAMLVGMPGAFTTTCTKTHLPGYIENAAKLAKLGVNKIAVITTNDKFVNGAWAEAVGLDVEDEPENSPVVILSDGDSELVKELGLVEDMGFGVGMRSKRFALVVEDGVVSHMEVDDGMDDCISTSAENMIEVLTPIKEEEGSELELDGKTLALLGGGAALAILYLGSLGGDAHTTATTMQSAAPAIKKEAVETSFSLLENFR